MHYTPLTILDFAISFGETLRQDPKIEQDLKSRSYAKTFTMQDLYTVYADKKNQGYALDDYASVFNFVMNLVAADELPDKLYSVEIDFLIYAHKTFTDPNVSVFSKIELRAAMANDVLDAVLIEEIDCKSL